MRRHAGERGAALILLLGIAATLAILAATLAMVVVNQQGATASEREHKTSLYYAEAALDDAVTVAKTKTIPQTPTTPAWLTPAELATSFAATSFPAGATVTYRVYDNVDANTPVYDANMDGKVWIEATVRYQGKTSRMRVLVIQTKIPVLASLPRAVLYADTSISAEGTSDMYAVNPSTTLPFTPYTTPYSTATPYPSTVTTGGSFTGNSNTNLAAPSSSAQSLGIFVNAIGNVSLPGITENGVWLPTDILVPASAGPPATAAKLRGRVLLLSDYFDQGAQADLADLAQTAILDPVNGAKDNLHGAATMTSAQVTQVKKTTSQAFTAPGNLYYNGSLTLDINATNGVSSFTFSSLYVTGDLIIRATKGTIVVNTGALYVGGSLTIAGPSGANMHRLKVNTGPVYALKIAATGAYDLDLGPTWIAGDAGTPNVAVSFSGPDGGSNSPSSVVPSLVLCPVLATTEKTETLGRVDFGTPTDPMVYFMQCDNDGLYSNWCDWGSTGTFYGLMVLMEARIVISNGIAATPSIVGSLFCGSPIAADGNANDITLTEASNVCYNQAVIDVLKDTFPQTTTTTLITTVVPGSWQELSPQ